MSRTPEEPFGHSDPQETADAVAKAFERRGSFLTPSSSVEIPTSLTIARIIKGNGYLVSDAQGKLVDGNSETMPIGIMQRVELPTKRVNRLIQQVADTLLPRRYQWLGVLYFDDLSARQKYHDYEMEWVLRMFGETNEPQLQSLASKITAELHEPITIRLGEVKDHYRRSYFRG